MSTDNKDKAVVTVVDGKIVPVVSTAAPVIVVSDGDDDEHDSDYDGKRTGYTDDDDSATEPDDGFIPPPPFVSLDFAQYAAPMGPMTPRVYAEYNRTRHRFDADWALTPFCGYTKVKPNDRESTIKHKEAILDIRALIVRGSIAVVDDEAKKKALVQRAHMVNEFLRLYRRTPPPVRPKKRKAVAVVASSSSSSSSSSSVKEPAPKKAAVPQSFFDRFHSSPEKSAASSSSKESAPKKAATEKKEKKQKQKKSKTDNVTLSEEAQTFLDNLVTPYQKMCMRGWTDASTLKNWVVTGSKSLDDCKRCLMASQNQHGVVYCNQIAYTSRALSGPRCRRSGSADSIYRGSPVFNKPTA